MKRSRFFSAKELDASMANAVQDDLCSICLCCVEESSSIDGCCHKYCLECITHWANIKTSCPYCKAPFLIITCPAKGITKYCELPVAKDCREDESEVEEDDENEEETVSISRKADNFGYDVDGFVVPDSEEVLYASDVDLDHLDAAVEEFERRLRKKRRRIRRRNSRLQQLKRICMEEEEQEAELLQEQVFLPSHNSAKRRRRTPLSEVCNSKDGVTLSSSASSIEATNTSDEVCKNDDTCAASCADSGFFKQFAYTGNLTR